MDDFLDKKITESLLRLQRQQAGIQAKIAFYREVQKRIANPTTKKPFIAEQINMFGT
jgi:hypothetical protein